MKNVFITILLTVLLLSLFGCQSDSKPQVDGDKLREYAGDLINRSLFNQAIDVYKDYLDTYKIDERERANVNYIIANTYFERLNDYESALAYYLKVKHLYPESGLIDDINKQIVACLERLERSEDAQQALDEAVQMDPQDVQKKRPGAVVARIGDREITQGDLDFEISKLPPSVRPELRSPEQKMQFLREYVATELLYDTAKRAGFDKDPEVIEGAFQAKKSLMVQKLLQDRVAAKAEVEPDDVELYYEANKEQYAEKDEEGNVVRETPLSEVREQVAEDLARQKFQNAYQAMIERMMLTEDVQFFDDKIN